MRPTGVHGWQRTMILRQRSGWCSPRNSSPRNRPCSQPVLATTVAPWKRHCVTAGLTGNSAAATPTPTTSVSVAAANEAPGRNGTSRSPTGWSRKDVCIQPGSPSWRAREQTGAAMLPTKGSAKIEVPSDLAAALAAEPKALAMFETLSRQNRYAILYRIGTAKRPENASAQDRAVRRNAGKGRDDLPAETHLINDRA